MEAHHLLLKIVAVGECGIAEDDAKVEDGFRRSFQEAGDAGGIGYAQPNQGKEPELIV